MYLNFSPGGQQNSVKSLTVKFERFEVRIFMFASIFHKYQGINDGSEHFLYNDNEIVIMRLVFEYEKC